MRVNSRVFTERQDIFNLIQIPNCPSQLKVIAENIVNMATKPGYSVGDYNTMTELDKQLMLDYWKEYDGLPTTASIIIDALGTWFIHKATFPALITRARRWLVEHHYLILKPDVIERAYEAESKFSKAVKG